MKKAYVLINCDLGYEEDALASLCNMKSVNEAHGTFGAYYIIEVVNKNIEELRKNILWTMHSISSIRDTLTLMSIEVQG